MNTTHHTIPCDPWTASLIERAQRASFYGVMGDTSKADVRNARRECTKEVEQYLEAHQINYDSFLILDAKGAYNSDARGYRGTITFSLYT